MLRKLFCFLGVFCDNNNDYVTVRPVRPSQDSGARTPAHNDIDSTACMKSNEWEDISVNEDEQQEGQSLSLWVTSIKHCVYGMWS